MALKNDKEKKICAKYSARDADGFVHCDECPLIVNEWNLLCKACAHYDRRLKEWVLDEKTERRTANDNTRD